MNQISDYFIGINLSYIKKLPEGAKILDYGCGQGELTLFFLKHGYRVVAADIKRDVEKNIRHKITNEQNKNFIFINIKHKKKSLSDHVGTFDIICLREVLEHLENPGHVLQYLSHLLNPGGLLILSVPTAFSEKYFTFWDKNWLAKSQHTRVFSQASIKNLLQKASFELTAVEGQSFKWSLFWSLLAPFQIKHEMGNPKSHRALVKVVMYATRIFCSIPYCEFLGNKLFPKSYFFYAKKHKPRILVVYDYPNWILGKWASKIINLFSNDYNIISMSMFHAYRDKRYAKQLINKVDLLHLLLPQCFSYFHKLSPTKPKISTIHHWVEWGERYHEAAFFSQKLVTGANQWKEKLIEKNVAPEKITVVHSGIDRRFLAGGDPLLEKSSKMTIGFFAKHTSNESDRKGTRHFKNLLNFIAGMKTQHLFRAVLSGPGWDTYTKEIRKHGIEVLYLNYVTDEDMPALYRSLDVYLMMSDIEGGPVTISEAMASKCLVFTTAIGVAKDIVIDRVNGILIDNQNCEDIYNKLIYYWNNQKERNKICSAAYDYAKNNMLFDKTFQPLGDTYRQVFDLVEGFNEKPLDVESINRKNNSFSENFKT